MQPLDVACFQPLKHYHRQSIDQAVMLGATKFPVTEFFCIYNEICERAFTPSTILSAFRKTGIHPFNPEKVVASLRIRQEMAAAARKAISLPSTPPLASSPSLSPSKYFTPHKVSEIDAMQTHLQGILVQEGVSASTLTIFDKTRKGAMAGLHAGEVAKQQLHDSQIAAEARDLQCYSPPRALGLVYGRALSAFD
jgi:hypothetical protein